MTHFNEFSNWYEKQRNILKQDAICQFFHNARNENQHIEINPMNWGSYSKRSDGTDNMKFYLDNSNNNAPSEDIVTTSKKYLTRLAKIIATCYLNFGRIIDPSEYFTLENMNDLGFTIEDFEDQVGMPRGWTYIPNCTEQDRLNVIRREVVGSEIRPILDKNLGESWPEELNAEHDL